jgi:hypothetical protein
MQQAQQPLENVFTDAVAYLLTFRRLMAHPHTAIKAVPETTGRAATLSDADYQASQKWLVSRLDCAAAVDWDKIPTVLPPWQGFYDWLLHKLAALVDADPATAN